MHDVIISLFLLIVTAWQQSLGLEDGSMQLYCPLVTYTHLELLCDGVYNADLYLKYKDGLTSVNAPYKIFYYNQDGYYFFLVSFNDSPVQSCNGSIQLDNELDFFCGVSESPLIVSGTQFFCHKELMSYVDDLLYECTKPIALRFFNVEWKGEATIHYAAKTESKSGTSRGFPGLGTWLACLVCVFLQRLKLLSSNIFEIQVNYQFASLKQNAVVLHVRARLHSS
ncbi:uncharacterized protein LOC117140711 [Drosophila mauritiana]|uniref:Uncharacterized protein LOC117140711 n=1 Tax=Drosophila mauritiana TaxID=7226 RepID=A0A6P8JU90_DROMA|nr:uncharacterized protein LOC117140711 [Drosophila mauritiana]